MKTLELNQIENINGSGKCSDYVYSNSSFTEYEACVVCAGAGAAVGGAIFGGPLGLLGGWLGGSVTALFTC
ncbi:MAG: hypothetical protein KDC90_09175 [Ignavibacteriae bacterium]|nr:hypothetical protein [Ignavibacteriota bacterium]